MNLTFATKAVLEELTRMRLDGIEKVYIQDETLSCLKQLFDTEDQEEVSDEENPEIGLSKKLKSVSTISVEESSSPTKRKELPSNTPRGFMPATSISVFQLPEGTKESRWEWLREKVLECETCNAELNPNGKVVFGEGNLNADIFLCGEAPGGGGGDRRFSIRRACRRTSNENSECYGFAERASLYWQYSQLATATQSSLRESSS